MDLPRSTCNGERRSYGAYTLLPLYGMTPNADLDCK